jgi:sigma-54 dependent transcriptional regulator, acetoin dehydrogenase operon transcriptional activator AcoR
MEIEKVLESVVNIPKHHGPVNLMDEYEKLVQQVDALPTLKQVEQAYIMQVIELQGGNVKQSAKILGVSVKGLYNKLHIYGYNFKKDNEKQ